MYKLSERDTNDEESIEKSLLVAPGPDEESLEESSAPVTIIDLVDEIRSIGPQDEILQRII